MTASSPMTSPDEERVEAMLRGVRIDNLLREIIARHSAAATASTWNIVAAAKGSPHRHAFEVIVRRAEVG